MLICNMMNVSTEERLAFTMKRIEENPSNYSAWHFRCELINKTITEANAESVLKEGGSALLHSCVELDLNLNGLYTECDDQSAWYYLRSLVYLIVKFVKSGVLAKEKGVELISNELEALAELEEASAGLHLPDRLQNRNRAPATHDRMDCFLNKPTTLNL